MKYESSIHLRALAVSTSTLPPTASAEARPGVRRHHCGILMMNVGMLGACKGCVMDKIKTDVGEKGLVQWLGGKCKS